MLKLLLQMFLLRTATTFSPPLPHRCLLSTAVRAANPPTLLTINTVTASIVTSLNKAPDLQTDSTYTPTDALVTAATQPKFGDYQCNAALKLAKPLNMKPRDCATVLLETLAADPTIAKHFNPPTIAGPGFINLRLSTSTLQSSVQNMLSSPTLSVPTAAVGTRVIVDFSSPNVAKEMHVGHLRSTIIGDSLSNILEFRGHHVTRLNHVGDWGTQFGMLVTYMQDCEATEAVDLTDLVEFYKKAKVRFDEDEEFKTRARDAVVRLQAGGEKELKAWRSLCGASRSAYEEIYERLGIVGLEERGESFYNAALPGLCKELAETGAASISDGALCVFLEGYTNKDGSELPLLVQKTDGGFLYSTTDLAAVKQRVDVEKAERVLYVTDSGQAQHFQMVFKAAEKAGLYKPAETSLEHVPFGLVQGEDGKKFATRSGDTVKLKDLLDESVRRVQADLMEREGIEELSEEQENIANVVGISAVKYADLSLNRESNYKFSYDRMLALQGNTAPYMLYAYARVRSIVRKAGLGSQWPPQLEGAVSLQEEQEVELARNLVKFADVLVDVEKSLYVNRLCDYLYDTSVKFSRFYEACPVNKAESEEVKRSRLILAVVTARVLEQGLGLMGIKVLDKM